MKLAVNTGSPQVYVLDEMSGGYSPVGDITSFSYTHGTDLSFQFSANNITPRFMNKVMGVRIRGIKQEVDWLFSFQSDQHFFTKGIITNTDIGIIGGYNNILEYTFNVQSLSDHISITDSLDGITITDGKQEQSEEDLYDGLSVTDLINEIQEQTEEDSYQEVLDMYDGYHVNDLIEVILNLKR